jgi:Cysteine-rich secretory protein family
MQASKNYTRGFLTLLVLTLAGPGVVAQNTPSTPSPAEQALLQLANKTRAAHNLPPLQWDSAIASAARTHDQRMIHEPGPLEHQYPGEPDLTARGAQAGAHFTTIAENLARGTDPAQIHQKWMSTPTHRANLLDPSLNAIGIAVIDSMGSLNAVEDFSHSAPVQSYSSLAQRVADVLQAHGIGPAESNQDAQTTCTMQRGAAGTAKLVVQWDGPDPTLLPDALIRQIATGRYSSAEVGVCASKQPNPGFTTYNVAVLLY